MNVSQGIELLRAVEEKINEGDTPTESLRNIDVLSRQQSTFHQPVNLGAHCRTWAAQWYKSLHKNPAVFMYQLCGGYDKYIEYKYLLRRGNRAKDVPDMMRVREVEAYDTQAQNPNGEYHHNTPASLKELEDDLQ